MQPDPGIGQREIVGRKIVFEDGELETKYTLPFVDVSWRVPFIVLDLLGRPPRILEAKVRMDGGRLHTDTSVRTLHPIESIPPEDLATLVHFDPWWAFRGVSGVQRPWIESVFQTNIAHPFIREGKTFKIQDLRFPDGMDRLTALVAKDEHFHRRVFASGEIDLLALRRGPKPRPSRALAANAKSL